MTDLISSQSWACMCVIILISWHFSIKLNILGTNTYWGSFVLMSRCYHALSDPRTCTRCNSLCALFGQIDVETSWFGWCTMCNNTWHNRRIEGILLSVSRDFARRSLAALIGNKTTASTALAFLQTNTDCVKHSRQLRHHLNIQVLMWLCCPLEWWYESDSEAEE